MASRPVNDTPTSHYAVLGVSRGATITEIKQAYHKKAKAAHPDAGGSAAAMSRVNAAYHTLIDPALRRDYDADQENQAFAAGPADQSGPSRREPMPDHPSNAQAEQIARERTDWARYSSWELLRFMAPFAVVAIVLRLFIPNFIIDRTTLFALGLISFLPVYLFALSIIFLTDLPLRLVFADLVRLHPTTKHDRMSALAVILAFFPLAAIWAIWR